MTKVVETAGPRPRMRVENIPTSLSILVCSHNGHARINEVLGCLARQQISIPFQLIVVDNASDPPLEGAIATFIREHFGSRLVVVLEPTLGLMHARRRAIASATGDIICFVDDDNLLSDDYLSLGFDVFLEHPNVGAVGGRSLPSPITPPPPFFLPYLRAFAIGEQGRRRGLLPKGQSLWGAGLLCRRNILTRLFSNNWRPVLMGRTGGLQLTGDDAEIGLAITVLGYEHFYESKCELIHAISPSRFNRLALETIYGSTGAVSPALNEYRKACHPTLPLLQKLRLSTVIQTSGELLRCSYYWLLSWLCVFSSTFYNFRLLYVLRREKLKSLLFRRQLTQHARMNAMLCRRIAECKS